MSPVTLIRALALTTVFAAFVPAQSMSSPSYESECLIVLPGAGTLASTSFEALALVGGVTSGEMTSATYASSFSVICGSSGCGTTLCGDCNLDGVVTILDSLTAAQHGVGLLMLMGAQFANCDVNTSTLVDVLDALALAQFAAGLPVTLTCC